MTIYLPQLNEDLNDFPDVSQALQDPDGLLAMGGSLCEQRIISAYQKGIFPWFSADEPLLWWSPSERATVRCGQVHISKSMKRIIRKENFRITLNTVFIDVINACAQPRVSQSETWISPAMIKAYIRLHQQGAAHSVEVWSGDTLVGGLYGLCIGQTFCGESMFSLQDNSSKLALIAFDQHFNKHGGQLIDCQMQTGHLQSLGVNSVRREDFVNALLKNNDKTLNSGCWHKQPLTISLKASSD